MSCYPRSPPCKCNNPLAWGILAVGVLQRVNWCKDCTQPIFIGYAGAVYEGILKTSCKFICIESMRVYYNPSYITTPTVANYADCENAPIVEVIPYQEEPIPCTLAPYNSLCTNEMVRARGIVHYDCLLSVGLRTMDITEIQYGTDDLGLTSLMIIWTFNEPCTKEKITAYIFEICFRNYEPVIDFSNPKEDYEVLRGLTLGTEAWEDDLDIHILRKMKMVT